MAQKNRANMLTDIVSNIYNNLINFITGQNAQDRFVNLLDSSPNILSDKDQTDGYVGTDSNNEMLSIYYNENDTRANIVTKSVAGLLVPNKFYQINDAVGGTIALQVCAENALILHNFAIDLQTGEIGTYDITTDVFSPIVSSAQTLAQTLILGNTSGANDIEFDATQGLLFSNASRLREGTIDAGLGGLKGIAQICGAGYELKWENGRLYVMGSSGNTIRQSLYNLTTTPTVTDDDTLGYSVGSLWTLDDGTVYVCSDATTGAAVWVNKGNAFIVQIAFGNLAALEGASALSLTTIYVVTDAPYRIALKAEAVNKIGANGTIIDLTFSGSVYYDLATNTIVNGTMSDIDGNTWNGCLPSATTLGGSSTKNTFYQGATSNTLGTGNYLNTFEQDAANNELGINCGANTFKQYANGFIFGGGLQNVTIEANTTGANYTAGSYSFMYSQNYPATIFTDGSVNFHRYFDIPNDRIVVTNLSTLAVSYIGGGGGGVPYTGATADVDLGIHSLTADTIGIGVAAGAEKLHIDGGATTTRVKIDADNGVNRILSFRTDDLQRWALRVDGIESGANSGGDFQLRRYNDAGAYIDSPIAINRANGNITTAQNINGATPTELGYLSGVTSAIQTQINSKQAKTLANCADGTAITGVTTNQYSKGLLIPANSRGANDAPQIEVTALKTGSSGNVTIRMYWNTTNDLAGSPILLGTSGPAGATYSSMVRVLMIQVANGTLNATRTVNTTGNSAVGWVAGSGGPATVAINWTIDGYLICAVQNTSGTDSTVGVMIKLN
jgi:hypothetical protein